MNVGETIFLQDPYNSDKTSTYILLFNLYNYIIHYIIKVRRIFT